MKTTYFKQQMVYYKTVFPNIATSCDCIYFYYNCSAEKKRFNCVFIMCVRTL